MKWSKGDNIELRGASSYQHDDRAGGKIGTTNARHNGECGNDSVQTTKYNGLDHISGPKGAVKWGGWGGAFEEYFMAITKP